MHFVFVMFEHVLKFGLVGPFDVAPFFPQFAGTHRVPYGVVVFDEDEGVLENTT